MGFASYCADGLLGMLAWHYPADCSVSQATRIAGKVGIGLIKRNVKRKWKAHLKRAKERRRLKKRKMDDERKEKELRKKQKEDEKKKMKEMKEREKRENNVNESMTNGCKEKTDERGEKKKTGWKKIWDSGLFSYRVEDLEKYLIEDYLVENPVPPPNPIVEKIRGWFTKPVPPPPPRIKMVNKDSSVEFSDETINRKTFTSFPQRISMDISEPITTDISIPICEDNLELSTVCNSSPTSGNSNSYSQSVSEDYDSLIHANSDSSIIVMKAINSVMAHKGSEHPKKVEASLEKKSKWPFVRRINRVAEPSIPEESQKSYGFQKIKQGWTTFLHKFERGKGKIEDNDSDFHFNSHNIETESDDYSKPELDTSTDNIPSPAGLLVMTTEESSHNSGATVVDSSEERICYRDMMKNPFNDSNISNKENIDDQDECKENIGGNWYKKLKDNLGWDKKAVDNGVLVKDNLAFITPIDDILSNSQSDKSIDNRVVADDATKRAGTTEEEIAEGKTGNKLVDEIIDLIDNNINEFSSKAEDNSVITSEKSEEVQEDNNEEVLNNKEKDTIIKNLIKQVNNAIIDHLCGSIDFSIIGQLINRVDTDIVNCLDGMVHKNTIDSLMVRIGNDIYYDLVEHAPKPLIDDQISLVQKQILGLYEYVSDDSNSDMTSNYSPVNQIISSCSEDIVKENDKLTAIVRGPEISKQPENNLSQNEIAGKFVAIINDKNKQIVRHSESGPELCDISSNINQEEICGYMPENRALSKKEEDAFLPMNKINQPFELQRGINMKFSDSFEAIGEKPVLNGISDSRTPELSSTSGRSGDLTNKHVSNGSIYVTAPTVGKMTTNENYNQNSVSISGDIPKDLIVEPKTVVSEKRGILTDLDVHIGENLKTSNNSVECRNKSVTVEEEVLDVPDNMTVNNSRNFVNKGCKVSENEVEEEQVSNPNNTLMEMHVDDPEDVGDLQKLLNYINNPLDHWPEQMPEDIKVLYDRYFKEREATHKCIINEYGEEILVPIKTLKQKVDETCKKMKSIFKKVPLVEEEQKIEEPFKLTDEILKNDRYYKRVMRRAELERERATEDLYTKCNNNKVEEFCKILENYSDVPPDDPTFGKEFNLAPRVQNYLSDPDRPSIAKTGAFALFVASDREKIRMEKLKKASNETIEIIPKSLAKSPLKKGEKPLMYPDGKIPLPIISNNTAQENSLQGAQSSKMKKQAQPSKKRLTQAIPDDLVDISLGDETLERLTQKVKGLQAAENICNKAEKEMNVHSEVTYDSHINEEDSINGNLEGKYIDNKEKQNHKGCDNSLPSNKISDSNLDTTSKFDEYDKKDGDSVSRSIKENVFLQDQKTSDFEAEHLESNQSPGKVSNIQKLAQFARFIGSAVAIKTVGATRVDTESTKNLSIGNDGLTGTEFSNSNDDDQHSPAVENLGMDNHSELLTNKEDSQVHSGNRSVSLEYPQEKSKDCPSKGLNIQKFAQLARSFGLGTLIPKSSITEDGDNIQSTELGGDVSNLSVTSNSVPNDSVSTSSLKLSVTENGDRHRQLITNPEMDVNENVISGNINTTFSDSIIDEIISPSVASKSLNEKKQKVMEIPDMSLAYDWITRMTPGEDVIDFYMPDGTAVKRRRKRHIVINPYSEGAPNIDYLGKPHSCNPTPVWIVGPHEKYITPMERAAKIPIYKKQLPKELKRCRKRKVYYSFNTPLDYSSKFWYYNYVILSPAEVEAYGYDFELPNHMKGMMDLTFDFNKWLELEEEVDPFDIVKTIPIVNLELYRRQHLNYWVEKLKLATKKNVRRIVGQRRVYFREFTEICEFHPGKSVIDYKEKVRHEQLAVGLEFITCEADVYFPDWDLLEAYKEGLMCQAIFKYLASKQYVIRNNIDRSNPDYEVMVCKRDQLIGYIFEFLDRDDYDEDTQALVCNIIKSLALCVLRLGHEFGLPTHIILGSSEAHDYLLRLDDFVRTLNSHNVDTYPFGDLEEMTRV